jgi:hypothetical protein
MFTHARVADLIEEYPVWRIWDLPLQHFKISGMP